MFDRKNPLKVTVAAALWMLITAALSDLFFIELTDSGAAVAFYIVMTASGIILGMIISLYINRVHIKPIKKLQEEIEFVRTKHEPGTYLTISGLYELSELAIAINSLLEEIKIEQNELKESERKYKHLSFFDSLTGLYNRSYFEYEMKRISQNPGGVMPISIISVDIDGHKIINDTFGHQAGDRQLKYAAEILKTSIRKEDTLVRSGGDEFCIILPNMPNHVAQQRKNDILEAIDRHNSTNPFIPLSVSVGVATNDHNNEKETVSDVYHRADEDMYYHKYDKKIKNDGRITEYLLTALSERDYISQGHADRLTVWAEKMADRIGLQGKERENLILLAKLHDIGNIGIPEELLFKIGELTHEERYKIRTHVNIGYNIASRSGEVSHIADLILHHHEWWNGKGYPSGLKEKEIPMACRIISILDAYDAITTYRLHHVPDSEENALEELARCSGTQFDPELVKIFIEVYKEGNI